jgi:hypothetical protein
MTPEEHNEKRREQRAVASVRNRDRRMLSDEAFCLRDLIVTGLKADGAATKTFTLITDFGRLLRKFYTVDVAGTSYWADTITGTLYRRDGSNAAFGRMRIEFPK